MPYTHHTIALITGSQDEIDLLTCQANKIRVIDIFRLGLKEALTQCPKPAKQTLKQVKNLIK